MRRLALFLISLCLALPVLAADAARPERKEVFGNVTVHYSAFTSSMLTPEVAAATGLVRSKNQGVLNIAVLKADKPAMAVVSGTVKDLTGAAARCPSSRLPNRARCTTSPSSRSTSQKPSPST